tara:strand:+ start:131 stop:643 length:513 start_codon:yes stop_codon:yes gene_type:complete
MSISTVTSEALQLKLRQLLPSQQGFGTDLSASDTIIPVIDLTRAAEGSDVPEFLQTALAFGSQTAFFATNATVTVVNTAGFYRIFGVSSIRGTGNQNTNLSLTDGASTKVIWQHFAASGESLEVDFVVYFNAGESLTATASTASSYLVGSSRQIADVNGVLVNPSGFTPQ